VDKRTKASIRQFSKYDYHSSAAIPFRLKGKTIGMLNLVSDKAGLFKAPEEVNLLAEMGLDISFALDSMAIEAERKRAEQALVLEKNKLSATIENTNIGFVLCDGQGDNISMNAAALQFHGFASSAEMHQRLGEYADDWELRYPDGHLMPLEEWPMARATRGDYVSNFETYLLNVKTGHRWVGSYTALPVRNSAGEVTLIVMTILNITERKLAEEELKSRTDFLDKLIESSALSTWISDEQGTAIRTNPACLKFFGATAQEVIGKYNLFQDAVIEKQGFMPEIKRVFEKGEAASIMLDYDFEAVEAVTVKDASHKFIHSILTPILDGNGKVSNVIVQSIDLTEIKKAEEEIQQLNVTLEKRVEERTVELRLAQEQLVHKEKLAVLGQLAGGVGHELRNPLGVISNSVYYLKLVQPDANEKITKHYGMIEQEVHNATKIVSDLLDYAREISTDPKAVSVPELVEHTLSRFPVPASIQLILNSPADLPQVYADPLHVEQILGNLITNAYQSIGADGKLTISAKQKKKMLAISVKDTGTGITPENMTKLFEPLFSTKVTGIGLGLAVSKKLAEANGGRIEVESQVGKGSIFMLYLPVVSLEAEG